MLLLAVGSRQSHRKRKPSWVFLCCFRCKNGVVSHVSFLDSWTVEMESSSGLWYCRNMIVRFPQRSKLVGSREYILHQCSKRLEGKTTRHLTSENQTNLSISPVSLSPNSSYHDSNIHQKEAKLQMQITNYYLTYLLNCIIKIHPNCVNRWGSWGLLKFWNTNFWSFCNTNRWNRWDTFF